MTHKEFIVKRLNEFKATPTEWAPNRAAFGLQVMLMTEIYLVKDGLDFSVPTSLAILFMLNTFEPITNEWAAEIVDKTFEFLFSEDLTSAN